MAAVVEPPAPGVVEQELQKRLALAAMAKEKNARFLKKLITI